MSFTSEERKPPNGGTALHFAILQGPLEKTNDLVEHGGLKVDAQEDSGFTPSSIVESQVFGGPRGCQSGCPRRPRIHFSSIGGSQVFGGARGWMPEMPLEGCRVPIFGVNRRFSFSVSNLCRPN